MAGGVSIALIVMSAPSASDCVLVSSWVYSLEPVFT